MSMGSRISPGATAFESSEVQSLLSWVHEGHGLFFSMDHNGWMDSYQTLARAFGIRPHHGFVATEHAGCWSFRDCCMFDSVSGSASDGPISSNALTASIQRRRIHTYGMCAFPPVPGFMPLLVIDAHARSYAEDPNFAPHTQEKGSVNVTGWWVAAAFTYGHGRVVVSCDQTWFSDMSFLEYQPGGLFNPDNKWFMQRIITWLSASS